MNYYSSEFEPRSDENTPVKVIHTAPEYDAHEKDWANVQCECGRVRYDQEIECEKCFSMLLAGFRITEETAVLMEDEQEVLTRSWFHATEVADWADFVMDSEKTVHLGTRETAVALLQGRYRQFPDSQPYFIYEVTLDSDSIISPVVCKDLVMSWESDVDCLKGNTNSDFVRYVNSYENAGSISLIGNPAKMSVLNVEELTIQAGWTCKGIMATA